MLMKADQRIRLLCYSLPTGEEERKKKKKYTTTDRRGKKIPVQLPNSSIYLVLPYS